MGPGGVGVFGCMCVCGRVRGRSLQAWPPPVRKPCFPAEVCRLVPQSPGAHTPTRPPTTSPHRLCAFTVALSPRQPPGLPVDVQFFE